MSGQTLSQQLKLLHSETLGQEDQVDVDETADLDGLVNDGESRREHYVDVGPSKLRAEVSQTLLGARYAGKKASRVRIFDDDDDEEEKGDDDVEDGEEEEEGSGDEQEDEEEDDENAEDDDDEGFDEDEDNEEDSEGEDDGDEENEEDEEEDVEEEGKARKQLDPIASLRESRLKDIEKGRGIRRQKALFDQLITLRITLQKAFSSAYKLPSSLSTSTDEEVKFKRDEALEGLINLSEDLFTIREKLSLPGAEVPNLGKRKRDEEYWFDAARQSLAHPHVVPILSKWATKIHAASQGLKVNKFSQSSTADVFEVIDAGLAAKRESEQTFEEGEEWGYRALLREVIDSRQGGGEGLSMLRKEKKKKREADRGGSKGRKLRYTVHEKAQNFVVPIPLSRAWHEEQIEELFSSLFGGAGLKGAVSRANPVTQGNDEGVANLGGLRVF
ncbi:hypothetical protein TREMEDRAFT_66745 [Tremella mesenterica DSM 1558]|uniref:uncharacterized protein n=1 Tax=Tremella mesenterica (strain ATCC 24925 / CBS 8224 / DSM 1558 / NBRC 9311 / NRRL Y-6157 / RJB 2259-6 / UBC 559-6) TaxID=578456 RepID=UPI0003F496DD|nr:uncharacterized protein TREMEDRAFT_66745 [Tremella mesenterica DSM 1558]EIW72172.1 hypothetical protein TREMEDRAFT_66745 [Tremella mesenterica DSM 1558]